VTIGGMTSNWSEIRSFTTEIYPIDIQLQNTTTFPTKNNPGEFVSADYRIFGIPGDDFAPLGDLLGGTAGSNWQAYWDNGQSSNYLVKFDGSGIFNTITGRAFWLVSNGAVTVYMTASTAPLNSDQEAEIDVHPGWNLITDPFPFAVNWDAVRIENDITVPLWSFTGNVGSLWTQSGTLQPYVGYYFDNTTNLSKLNIPYRPAALGKPVVDSGLLWHLTVEIKSAGLSERVTQLGVADNAQAGLDRYDYRKPRGVAGGLPGVYFDHSDWPDLPGAYASDIRAPFEGIERWHLTVTAEAGTKVDLTVEGLETVPEGLEIYLVDREHLLAVDLNVQGAYTFTAAKAENGFEILVGSGKELEEELNAVIPQAYELGQNYPNPFNPLTTIPLTLPEDSRITLRVYNLLGQEIRTLYSGQVQTGKHYFNWDGSDQSGHKMPTGIYLYRLTTDKGVNLTGKMVMVK
jgi:hypothetical protein